MKSFITHVLKISILCFYQIFFLLSTSAVAQSFKDSIQRKNVIKFDIVSPAFYNQSTNLTYERVLKSNQTASITFGLQQLPTISSLFGGDSVALSPQKSTGFKIGADYRFYLAKENKYAAPHGVYIGPYISYHDLKNNWDISHSGTNGIQTGSADARFQVLNAGFQVGYQFLISNRFTIDMTFIGGSLTYYRARMNVDGDFDIDEGAINEELLAKLKEKFPLLGSLLNDASIDESGKAEKFKFGYRYLVNVGYAFGGNPKKNTIKQSP